jgi:hypothetical protein
MKESMRVSSAIVWPAAVRNFVIEMYVTAKIAKIKEVSERG